MVLFQIFVESSTFILQTIVEDLNVITALKCNKLLSVITFGLKCNNVIPTSSVTLLTCCWLLVVISNSNWTEWSTIQGVIARVISKSDEREARGRFEITSTITS